MADLRKQILIRLTLENGQEVLATMQAIDAESEEIISSSNLMGNELAEGFNKAKTSAVQYNQVSELTTNQLLQQTRGWGQARAGLNQFGYVLNDAAVFTIDFRMGMMGIANNIPMVVQGFQALTQSAQEAKIGLGTALRQAIMGPTGVLIGINALMTGIMLLLPLLDSAKEKTKDLADETKNLKNELERASYETLRTKEIETRVQLALKEAEAEKEISETLKKRQSQQQFSTITRADISASEETQAEIEALKEQLGMIGSYQSKLGLLSQTENKILELREEQRGLRDQSEIQAIQKEIDALEEKKKIYLGTNEETRKANILLNDLITTDQELLQQLSDIDKTLQQANTSERERNLLLQQRVEILNELMSVEKDRIDQIIDEDLSNAALGEDFIFDDVKIKPEATGKGGAQTPKEDLVEHIGLVDDLTDSYYQAGFAISDAAVQSIDYFRNANSLLEIFISKLVQAILQAVILKGVMSFLKLAGGPAGAATALLPIPALAEGGVAMRPTLSLIGDVPEAIIPLHRLQGILGQSNFGSADNSNPQVTVKPVINLSGELELELDRLRVRLQEVEENINKTR